MNQLNDQTIKKTEDLVSFNQLASTNTNEISVTDATHPGRRLVTVLFMQTRIRAQVFPNDTLSLFLARVRKIIPKISSENQIGLYEIENNNMQESHTCQEGLEIKAPVSSNQIITHLSFMKMDHSYLILYIDSIDFGKEKEFTIGTQESIPQVGNCHNAYFKVLRGSSTTNQVVICPYATCLRQYKKMQSLRIHVLNHTGDRPFTCEIKECSKSFLTRGQLKAHQMIHTGEKPYQCKQCGKRFQRVERMKIHMNTHLNSKPYVCKICNKGFTEKPNIKIHMRLHTGEKPFLCEEPGCTKSYVTQG